MNNRLAWPFLHSSQLGDRVFYNCKKIKKVNLPKRKDESGTQKRPLAKPNDEDIPVVQAPTLKQISFQY
jgi:hypothetical protein